MDWNPVIQILDELRDGMRSLLDLNHAMSRCDRDTLVQSLQYLADRELIELSESRHPFKAIPKMQWKRRLREAFESGSSEPFAMTDTSVDLSERGKQVLQLFGIGYL